MKLKLSSSPNKYFRLLLEILSAFKPFNSMTNRQKDVFAEILLYNHIYKEIPPQERVFLIFNTRTKNKITTKLNMSLSSLDYNLSKLREGGFIDRFNNINPRFNFKYLDSINFNFSEDENK